MAKSYVSMFFKDFKDKFTSFNAHSKKVRGLERFASVQPFPGDRYVPLFKQILKDGFLDQEEEKFLEHLINRIELDALGWAYKTPWIKSEMKRLKSFNERPTFQLALPFDKKPSIPAFSLPALVSKHHSQRLRA